MKSRIALTVATLLLVLAVVSLPQRHPELIQNQEVVAEIKTESQFAETGYKFVRSYETEQGMVYELKPVKADLDTLIELSKTLNARIMVLNLNDEDVVDYMAEYGELTYRR